MRILVTGAHGYVGSQVWPHLLAAGHEVTILSRGGRASSSAEFHEIEADLLSPGVAEQVARTVRPDMLVHLAWSVEHGRFWTDPANLDWVAASLRLARAVAEAGAKRIVATGTCFEYDWPGVGDCREAETPLAGHTLYDAAKSALRMTLEPWAAQAGVAFAWARLFYLYGGEEHPARLVPDVARSLVAGRPAACSSGKVARDFMDVRDAGAAIAALALSDVSGAVNIATGQGPTIAEIAQALGKIAARPDLVRLGARPDRPDEPPRIVADIARLRDEVGFAPAIGLRQGLEDAVAHWRRANTDARR